MVSEDDKPKLPAQAVLVPSLISTGGVLLGFAAYMLGEDRMGIWFYPAIAVAVVVWLHGQTRLVLTVTRFAREQREKQESDSS